MPRQRNPILPTRDASIDTYGQFCVLMDPDLDLTHAFDGPSLQLQRDRRRGAPLTRASFPLAISCRGCSITFLSGWKLLPRALVPVLDEMYRRAGKKLTRRDQLVDRPPEFPMRKYPYGLPNPDLIEFERR